MNKNNDVIFIGSKPFNNYVMAVIIQFNNKGTKNLLVKARGKYINRAVDVAEVVLRNKAVVGLSYNGVSLGSETFKKEEKEFRVSTIEIGLKKLT